MTVALDGTWVCMRLRVVKAYDRGLINGGAQQREVGRASGKRSLGDLVWQSVEHLENRLSQSRAGGEEALQALQGDRPERTLSRYVSLR